MNNRLSDIQEAETGYNDPGSAAAKGVFGLYLNLFVGAYVLRIAQKSDLSIYTMMRLLTHIAVMPNPEEIARNLEMSLTDRRRNHMLFFDINNGEDE